jgi:uncharacterized protein (DUF2235 family)
MRKAKVDKIAYIGFNLGAYTARSMAGFIAGIGIYARRQQRCFYAYKRRRQDRRFDGLGC